MPGDAGIATKHARADDCEPGAPPAVGRFEQLPKWLNLVPMVLQWLWLGAAPRQRHPALVRQPRHHRRRPGRRGKAGILRGDGTARARRDRTRHRRAQRRRTAGGRCCAIGLRDAGLDFPLVAKPDLGWCGYRRAPARRCRARLDDYLREFPRDETLRAAALPARQPARRACSTCAHPDAARGSLFGILLRDCASGHRQRSRHASPRWSPPTRACAARPHNARHAVPLRRRARSRARRTGRACRRWPRPASAGTIAMAPHWPAGAGRARRCDRARHGLTSWPAASTCATPTRRRCSAASSPSWRSTAPAPKRCTPGIRSTASARCTASSSPSSARCSRSPRPTAAAAIDRSASLALARLFFRQRRLIARYPASN